MGEYVYCLVDPAAAPPVAVTGLGGAAVARVERAGLAAWVSSLERRPRAELATLRAHDGVARAALDGGTTPLPLRFGQWAPDADAAAASLEPHADAYRAALERVRGCVEMGVAVVAEPQVGEDAAAAAEVNAGGAAEGPGTAYLRGLARRSAGDGRALAAAQRLAARVRERVGRLAREERTGPLRRPAGALSVAHLVPREHEAAYREAVEDLRKSLAHGKLVVTGPWPPYSFAPDIARADG